MKNNFLERVKLEIKKSKDKIDVGARDDEFNRKIIEYGKFRSIVGIEYGERKDSLRNINSGFNTVLGKIATKNNISIGIDIKKLRESEKKQKAIILSKIIQNIKICRKTKTKIRILNAIDNRNASSFMQSLGSSTLQIKESLDF